MAMPDRANRQYVSRDQKLIFIFAFNLVKSGDRFQAIRLQRFLNEAHVIDDDQVKNIKAKGSPAERSIEILSAVYRNCSKRRGVFEDFCRVVADKHQTILLDHMPGIKEGRTTLTFGNIDDEELKEFYGTLKDRGDPFRPKHSIFETSRQHPNSYKELADVRRVKFEEHLVPSETVNFQVLWFTDTENQMKAVLAMLRKHKGLKGDLTLYSSTDRRFSYYSIVINDGKVFIHLVCCSNQERFLVYSFALTYSKFHLDFAILTGRCLLFDKEGSDRMRGDICIVEKALDSKLKGVRGKIGVSADVSRVGDTLRMKLEFRGEDPPSSGLLLHTSDATEMPRPVASYYAQMIWLTRLHLEILEAKKGKRGSSPSKWLQETGYDWDYEVTERKKANDETLRKFLPDWDKDGSYRGLLSYCKDSGFWLKVTPKVELNKTVEEKAEEEMAINVETELESDVREHPRLHVASFASKQEIEMARENIVGMDSSTYEFYEAVDATRKQLLFASIKAVDGFVGCYSDKCPEPRLQPYCDRLAAVAALDLIERIRQK